MFGTKDLALQEARICTSKKIQRVCDMKTALRSLLIKIHCKGMSVEDLNKEISLNPYLEYFLGLWEYRYECPFDAGKMTSSVHGFPLGCLQREYNASGISRFPMDTIPQADSGGYGLPNPVKHEVLQGAWNRSERSKA